MQNNNIVEDESHSRCDCTRIKNGIYEVVAVEDPFRKCTLILVINPQGR